MTARPVLNKRKWRSIRESALPLFIILILSFSGCKFSNRSLGKVTDQKIDSLIEVKRINEKTLLITFGYDAITAINAKNGIIVIDAGISPGLTSRYRKKIEKEFNRKDFIYVINSHGHPDHYGGNSVFPEAMIVGQVNSLREIAVHNENLDKVILNLKRVYTEYDSTLKTIEQGTIGWIDNFTQKIRYQFAYNDASEGTGIKQPGITFYDTLDIDAGDITLNLLYFGEAHSASDILIFIPELAILFTGDLLFSYGRPAFNTDKDPDRERWNRSIEWINERRGNIEVIIGGHGQILSSEDLESFLYNITPVQGLQ
jgi:glyoxylase-like metal-dependent hydrolase (beta-lactamase superfamily II)